ncbi:hypothetical protein Tco_0369061 [Tanacetum coccineum]
MNIFPQLLIASIKDNLPSLNKRISQTLKTEMNDILEESLKLVNKKFSALNNMEALRFTQPYIAIRKTVHKNVRGKMNKASENDKSPFMDFDDKHLDTPVNVNVAPVQGESQTSGSSTATNPLAIVIHSNDEPEVEEPPQSQLKSSGPMTLEEVALQLQEIKWLVDLKAVKDKSEEALRKLTPTQRYVDKLSKKDTMYLTRNNQPLNNQIYDDFKLKMLRFLECWVKEIVEKLKIPPLHQLTETKRTLAEKKRKTKIEVFRQVFLDKEFVVDGMERNLTPPHDIRIMDAELMRLIESRHDYEKAKDIVAKNLDDYDFFLALNLSIEPFALILTLYTYLQPMRYLPLGCLSVWEGNDGVGEIFVHEIVGVGNLGKFVGSVGGRRMVGEIVRFDGVVKMKCIPSQGCHFVVKEKNMNASNLKVVKDGVVPSVIVAYGNTHKDLNDDPVAIEVQSLVVDQTNAVKIGGGSYPPLPTQGTTLAGNIPGKSSYANVIGE